MLQSGGRIMRAEALSRVGAVRLAALAAKVIKKFGDVPDNLSAL
jgi:hypothetical protein